MDDQKFIDRIHEKIERLTGRTVDVRIDDDNPSRLEVEFGREVPLVVLGRNIFDYAGFARMCVEYAVESIRRQRPISPIEFHMVLARN